MKEEIRQKEVNIKFYLPDHNYDFWMFQHANKMFEMLVEIDNRCRDILKYEENAHSERQKVAEEIRELISSELDLYEI